MFEKPIAKKLAIACLVISGFALFGCIMGGAINMCTPMAVIFAGSLVAYTIAEQRE